MPTLSSDKTAALAAQIRHHILTMTTAAGSGHPSSSLSATDLLAVLLFGGFFRANLDRPDYGGNDRLIFSKGHAAPLLYALYAAAGKVGADELKTLRAFGSRLEGHPTLAFPYTEVATGSLGQGLSVGVGMAMAAKYVSKLPYRTFVLLGDSEMAEGSVWEAIQLSAHYKLDNLIGIVDVNRLGQRGETMYGHDVEGYAERIAAFGWHTIVVDGHSLPKIAAAYKKALTQKGAPTMIIARTLKGKGVKIMENQNGWHGKPLNQEQCLTALADLGKVNLKLKGHVAAPPRLLEKPSYSVAREPLPAYVLGEKVATRKAYGQALAALKDAVPEMVVLDAETSNSTFAELFKEVDPKRFFEMFIAEQNMAGVALGFSARGFVPFISTFAAFFSRAHDQLRMSQYSGGNIKCVGSHAGVSIGEDGASQMGLEDIALFRSLWGSVVLYPSDAVSTYKLVSAMAQHRGLAYLRTTRKETPVLYEPHEEFAIGGSKVVKSSNRDQVTLVGCGATLFEALAAYDELKKKGITARVIDAYSVKPLDRETLLAAAHETEAIITIEDHYPEGGLGEAVAAVVSGEGAPVTILSVRQLPRSGKPQELLAYESIDAAAIVAAAERALKK